MKLAADHLLGVTTPAARRRASDSGGQGQGRDNGRRGGGGRDGGRPGEPSRDSGRQAGEAVIKAEVGFALARSGQPTKGLTLRTTVVRSTGAARHTFARRLTVAKYAVPVDLTPRKEGRMANATLSESSGLGMRVVLLRAKRVVIHNVTTTITRGHLQRGETSARKSIKVKVANLIINS
jgi:hypothetical protein